MGTSTPPTVRLRDLILHLYRGHGSIDLRALLRDSGDNYRDLTVSMPSMAKNARTLYVSLILLSETPIFSRAFSLSSPTPEAKMQIKVGVQVST